MNIFNLLWFIVGCASGYVATLMIIFIMTVDRDGRLPYEPPAIKCEYMIGVNGQNGESHER
ncbi:MAG: hypothetical protein R6X32_05980 [Chloroflexota bacterium]